MSRLKLAIIINLVCGLLYLAFFLLPAIARAGDMPEPPLRMLLKWTVDEVPGKATLYYDIDGDRKADLVYAHDVLSMEFIATCLPPSFTRKEIILSTGCKGKPMIYILKREIVAVRAIDERWYFTARLGWPQWFACKESY